MNSHNRNFLISFPFLLSTLLLLLLLLFAHITVETSANAQPPLTYDVRLDGLKKDVDGLSSRYMVTNTASSTGANTAHQFYDDSNQLVYLFVDTIGAGASKVYSLANISSLPIGYTGYITIASDMPITASLLPDLPVVVPPQGIIIHGCSSGMLSTNYTFTATVAPVTTTVPITYVWQASTNTMITHTADLSDTVVYSWTMPGPQVITVTVANVGGTVTGTHIITIYTPVAAAFTASLTSGVAPLHVVFTNTSTDDYTASLWDFGDGVTSTQTSPAHTYIAKGAYTVTLAVSGPGGTDTETKTGYITVRSEYNVYLPLVLRNY